MAIAEVGEDDIRNDTNNARYGCRRFHAETMRRLHSQFYKLKKSECESNHGTDEEQNPPQEGTLAEHGA